MGVIEKLENGYAYTSNIRNEQKLAEGYILTSVNYNLFGSNKKESRVLFPEFKALVENLRADILERAEINPDDSEWERLVKLSKSPAFSSGFYVQQNNDIAAE